MTFEQQRTLKNLAYSAVFVLVFIVIISVVAVFCGKALEIF